MGKLKKQDLRTPAKRKKRRPEDFDEEDLAYFHAIDKEIARLQKAEKRRALAEKKAALLTAGKRRSKSGTKGEDDYDDNLIVFSDDEDDEEEDLTLAGKCLVYIGSAHKEQYNEAVIYITECSPESVKGIMINKLMFGTAVVECRTKEDDSQGMRSVYEDLYQGGPVNPASGFVLFPSEEFFYSDPRAKIQGNIAISSSFGVLQDILDGVGPEKKIIAMGHCVWKRGELEWEIFNNEWLIVPANSELIFDTRFEDRWEKAKLASGLNLGGYIPHIGLA